MNANPNTRRLDYYLKYLLLTGIVGWIVSLYTLWHRAKVRAGVDLGQSFCNINDSVNCDAIALSSYSQILGIPVPILGLMFFACVTVLAFRAIKQYKSGSVGALTKKLLLAAGILGAVGSVGLFSIAMFRVGAFCLVCGIIYLLSFSILYLVVRINKLATSQHPEKCNSSLVLILLAAIAIQLNFQTLTNYAIKQIPVETGEGLPPETLKGSIDDYYAENAYELSEQHSPVVGSKTAKVTLVEFSDFECPHCAEHFKHAPNALRGLENDVRTIYKSYPLDPACNSGGSHRKACMAAWAARCVYKKLGLDSFKVMQQYLFTHQEEFNKETIQAKAGELGLKSSEFEACIENPEVKQEVTEEIELGKSLGVQATPTIFANGRKIKMGTSQDVLRAIVKHLISK